MSTTEYIESSSGIEDTGDTIKVFLSHELISLLSSQLYQSPIKAIEELVINSYDADAKNCRVFSPLLDGTGKQYVVIYDDGIGMSKSGLENLWQIGRSNKRSEEVEKRSSRKQIGRFGIGKLAANSIGNKLTYISKNGDEILAVKIDFSQFKSLGDGSPEGLSLRVLKFKSFDEFKSSSQDIFDSIGYEIKENDPSWTIAIIEDLKIEGVRKLKIGSLKWVLSTAMPLKTDFNVFLNGEKIESSKENYPKYVEFDLKDIGKERLDSISESLSEEWEISGNKLKSPTFPSGVSGSVIVTKKTLTGDKSSDLERSNGFFIRVRERLVNTVDGLFVEKALEHGAFNRFRADLTVDDLDNEIKASRENFEETGIKLSLQKLLREIFNEANARFKKAQKEEEGGGKPAEGQKSIVAPRLVEFPVADALIESNGQGSDADDTWFYVNVPKTDSKRVAETLYVSPRKSFSYAYTNQGKEKRLVRFDPEQAQFLINKDHEIAKEYDHGIAGKFLKDFATAEAMLEIYLREAQVQPHIIGNILEKRDQLLRSLVKDRPYSNKNIAQQIRDARDDDRELEIAQVVAMRSLGFVAKHISNGDNPDGLARFTAYPDKETKIVLEAKSSIKIPSLGAIDFATLERHTATENAQGCLLLAPDFPGQIREEGGGKMAAASEIAERQKISCWKIETLAKFIENADEKRLTAQDLIKIVTTTFSPMQVTSAVEDLIEEKKIEHKKLYSDILDIFNRWESKGNPRQRNLDAVYAVISINDDFDSDVLTPEVVSQAISEMAHISEGGMLYRDDKINLFISTEELARRVSKLTGVASLSRRLSNFEVQ